MNTVAIDPGQNGCTLCLPSGGDVYLLDHKKMDSNGLYTFLEGCNPARIFIEDVHSLYGMSAKSNFRFGYNLGMVTAICELMDAPIIRVQPKIWQQAVGVTAKGKGIKKDVAKICKQLYPDAPIYGKRGGLLDGRSDALMIAHYGRYYYEN